MKEIIQTSEARCQDCYRCVRECALKAIALSAGQAKVLDNICVLCGRCVTSCPQGAKRIVDDVNMFFNALKLGEPVVVSVAPSIGCGIGDYSPDEVFGYLRALGVSTIRHTAEGAVQVAHRYKELYDNSSSVTISSCCPAVVNLIEKHYPELIKYLAPIESPMVTHARMLKKEFFNAKVFFLGPCPAKIQEAEDYKKTGLISGVLTFSSLFEKMHKDNYKPEYSQPIDGIIDGGLFPLSGGVLQAAKIEKDKGVVEVSGLEALIELFNYLKNGGNGIKFVEAMACEGGCLMGAGMVSEKTNVWSRREQIQSYLKESVPYQKEFPKPRSYENKTVETHEPTEEEIRAVLKQIGKNTPEDETNCGGCGYKSCREKAIAVCKGQAEVEMCVPYMKEKFRSFANLVVNSTPNGIIVVDRDMLIQEFNPTAMEWFSQGKKFIKGLPLSLFIDPSDFEYVARTNQSILNKRVIYSEYHINVEKNIIPLPEYDLVVGIMRDISEEVRAEAELDMISQATLEKATKVIEENMRVAQEIAGLLGETTAETKATLWEVISLVKKRREQSQCDSR